MEIPHENTENAVVRPKATYKESLLKPSGSIMEDDMDLHEQTDEDSPRRIDSIKIVTITLTRRNPLILAPLSKPFFLESEKAVRKIAAWIRIPNLPIELYNHRFLWRVGSTIGTMLKIDRATSMYSRGRFARICVKIDLTKKLVPKISVLGSILNIEYEGLHLICFKCGLYGHRSEQCSEPTEDMEEGCGVSGSGGDGSRSYEQNIIALIEDQNENSIKFGEQNQRRYDQSPQILGPG
ncbi:hypothetical protein AHAS_Ahas18G0234300 [Arachis hypogaea]